MANPVYAVVAHFDPFGLKSANWRTLLSCIAEVCQKGVIVSTGISDADTEAAIDKGFSVIRRENIGYDFMSYALGLAVSKNAPSDATRLVCNDSIYVTDPALFTASLRQVAEGQLEDKRNKIVKNKSVPHPSPKQTVTFLTRSTQAIPHGQSYCFSIPPHVFNRQIFQSFFQNIRPQASKFDIIYAYEIGLTGLLRTMNAPWSALYKPSLTAALMPRFDGGLNPTHFCADEIIGRHGFVKIERLTTNPKNIKNSKTIKQHLQEYTNSIKSAPMTVYRGDPKAVVVCHCHYIEVIDELIDALDRLPDGCEIHITSSRPEVLTQFKLRWRRKNVPLFLVGIENWGRDVRPFTFAIQNLKLPDNIPVLKLHGKRSLYSPAGDSWRKDLLQNLLPSEEAINHYIDLFKKNPKLGMLGTPGSYVSNLEYWGSNKNTVKGLLEKHSVELNDEDLGFYAGTMYWIRSQCAQLTLSDIRIQDFEKEASQRDGTLAHALERSIPMILRAKGWEMMEVGSDKILDPDSVRTRKVKYY
jgi:lipopolysaccharide biosynthesis protein